MQIEVEMFDDEEGAYLPVKLPARYEVCPSCEGNGTECTIGAMTGDEYRDACHDDQDFPENYRRGVYSRQCSCCKGKRVVAVIDHDRLDASMIARVEAYENEQADAAAERRHAQMLRDRGIEY